MDETLAITGRTQVKRLPERARYHRADLNAVLDEGLVAHVGIVTDDGPVVIPMVYGRDGDRLLLHGSVASRLLRHFSDGAEVCVTVTLVDALVLSRSQFHHSMNYRSAVVVGVANLLTDLEERRTALTAIVEHLVPGRSRESRPPSLAEARQTHVLSLPLTEASVKVRTGGPREEPEDLTGGSWGGVLPLAVVAGEPLPDEQTPGGIPAPAAVTSWHAPRVAD